MDTTEIFLAAVKDCESEINRDFISKITISDKTNTIKKYLNSFGMVQLAYYLQKLAMPRKALRININSDCDGRQKKMTKFPTLKVLGYEPKTYMNSAVDVSWNDSATLSDAYSYFTVGTNAMPAPPEASPMEEIYLDDEDDE